MFGVPKRAFTKARCTPVGLNLKSPDFFLDFSFNEIHNRCLGLLFLIESRKPLPTSRLYSSLCQQKSSIPFIQAPSPGSLRAHQAGARLRHKRVPRVALRHSGTTEVAPDYSVMPWSGPAPESWKIVPKKIAELYRGFCQMAKLLCIFSRI